MAVAVPVSGTMIAAAKLVDGDDEFRLTHADGVYLQTLDLGFPVVREVADVRTQQNGTDDRTEFYGARAVTVTLRVASTPTASSGWTMDRLSSFLRPSRRPWLVYTLAGQQERRIRLRADQRSGPLGMPFRVIADVQAGWRAPDGVAFSTTTDTASVAAASPETGRAYPLTFDRSYPAGASLGTAMLNVGGTAPAQPVSRLFGPFGGPGVRSGWANETTGQALEFVGLDVAAGDYVEINHAERTVRLNGLTDAASNRYRFLDFAASDWWSLLPGQVNTVRFYPDVFTVPAQALIDWNSTWL